MALLTLISMASAGFTVNIDPEGILADKSMKASQTVTHNFNISDGNLSSSDYTCYLFSTENGSSGVGDFVNKLTESSLTNDTNYNFTARNGVAEVSGLAYLWTVNCTDSEGTHNWSASNYTYGVDVTAPTLVVIAPTDGQWFNDNNTEIFSLNVTDDNNATCVLNTNINVSTDTVGELDIGTYTDSFDSTSYTNATAFNFSRINDTGTANFIDSNAGYKWEYSCNDTAGNIATLGSNYTFYMDTLSPSAFTRFDNYRLYSGNRLGKHNRN